MILHTGGFASGAISTRSKPTSSAICSADASARPVTKSREPCNKALGVPISSQYEFNYMPEPNGGYYEYDLLDMKLLYFELPNRL